MRGQRCDRGESEGLEPGARFADGLELRDRVPQSHKIALSI
jgi:hypothetical protein